jgi:putative membrane protein
MILVRWLVLTLAIMAAAHLIEGIDVDGFGSAFLAAAVLSILNTFFRPLLIVLTLPINILTFGLFLLVINAVLLKTASGLIGGFQVHGFGAAVLGSIVISVANWLLSAVLDSPRRRSVIDLSQTDKDRWE